MHTFILIIADIVIVIAAFLLSLVLRFKGVAHVVPNQWYTFVFLGIVTPLIFYFYDLYNHLFYLQRLRIFFRIVKAWLGVLMIYVILGFLTKFAFLVQSRAFILLFFSFLFIFLFVARVLLVKKIVEGYFAVSGRKLSCIYIGPPKRFKALSDFFHEHKVTGLVLVEQPKQSDAHSASKYVFLYSEASHFSELYREIKSNIAPGATLHVASKLFDQLNLGWEWCTIGPVPVYAFQQKRGQTLRDIVRRCIDIVGSALGLLFFSPLLLVVAVAIKLTSSGPVIYRQTRCGKNGRLFTLYKFRSMHNSGGEDAEQETESNHYIQHRTSKETTLHAKAITDIGRILRKTSMDEWPQFMNVLKGDMSLIGPRPPLPSEVKHYAAWHKDRLLINQGLTGLWQIYGRGEMPCDKSIFLDLMYCVNRSISLDIKLIFQTFPAVILGKGAY